MKRLSKLVAAHFLPVAPAVVQPSSEQSDFIRVRQAEQATLLETAIIRFERPGLSVDLIAAIHLADASYYHQLNRRFTDYDALLFEGVGGQTPYIQSFENPPQVQPADSDHDPQTEMETDEVGSELDEFDLIHAAPLAPSSNGALGGLHKIYAKVARWLGLTYQMEQIDYQRHNFVHADFSTTEFRDRQVERKESILGWLFNTNKQTKAAAVPELDQPSTFGMLKALLRRDRNALKRELVRGLGSADEQIGAMPSESVIITDRNAKCVQVLDQQILGGKQRLAIFYGAAHFPDIERRLIDDGWNKTHHQWLSAWEIGS